jgi:hypothetical protein
MLRVRCLIDPKKTAMLMQIISSLKTAPIEEDDFIDDHHPILLPKATELIIKLRNSDFKMCKTTIIQSFVLIGLSVLLFFRHDGSFSYISIIMLISPLFAILSERWQWHKARHQLMIELLGELVSENNRIKRLLPPDPTRL